MAIHNGLCCGTFTIISDPSEYSIESGLVLSGEEVKYMLINGSFTENTIIERGKFRYKVIGNTTRSKRFLQRIVPL
ncbi:MAG: hypothetical protein GYA16_12260 [Spirochaetes bacterium]|nr:hypothetical protein [Spirochaetota bacterium]